MRSPTADFFTTKVWTRQGLVTVYAVFVIELTARRVQVLGSTAHPDQAFMLQIVRDLMLANAARVRVLICDRDAKWSGAVRARLQGAGMRVVQMPYRGPNANAYAEPFIRSIREECLNHLIPFGEGITEGLSPNLSPLSSRAQSPSAGQRTD